MESQTMRHMIEDDCADNGIPLPNVNSKILSKVIEYCNKHVLKNVNSKAGSDDAGATAANSTAASGEDLKNWDANFVMVDQATLFDLILDLPDDVRIAQQKKLEELKRQQELQNQLAVQRTVQQELQIEELW